MGRVLKAGKRLVITHAIARKLVCLVCMKKQKGMQNVTKKIEHEIRTCHCSSIDFKNDLFPSSICVSCMTRLSQVAKGKNSRPLPAVYDYSRLIQPNTRNHSTKEHNCTVCDIAKETAPNIGNSGDTSRKIEMKKKRHPVLCGICGASYGPGYQHKCRISQMDKNLTKTLPLDTREKMASSAIRESMGNIDQNVRKGAIAILKTGGPKLRVAVKPNQMTPKKLTAHCVEDMMNSCNLSFTQTSRVLTTVRKALGQSSVAPNVMKEVVQKSHAEDDFFCLRTLSFHDKNDLPLIKTIPIVQNLESYLEHIFISRSLDPFETKIKIGIDFGGNSLKIAMSVIQLGDGEAGLKNNLCSQNRVLLLAIGLDNVTSNIQLIFFFYLPFCHQ